MKKWLIIVSILLLFILWQTIQMLMTIQSDKSKGLDQFTQLVTEETGYIIRDVQRFHGNELYYVFTANDTEGNTYYLFVNEKQEIIQLNLDEVSLSQDEVKALSLQEYQGLQKILRVNPAYTGNHFTWEVVAQDQEKRLHYLYYSMIDGTFQKRYTLGN
jgi:uncharacterized protein YpmB